MATSNRAKAEVAATDSALFWSTSNKLMRAAVDGTSPVSVFTSSTGTVNGPVLSGDLLTIYFVSGSGLKAFAVDGQPESERGLSGSCTYGNNIAVSSAGRVLWADDGTPTLCSVAAAGGASTLYTYTYASTETLGGVAADVDYAYWTYTGDTGTGSIVRASLTLAGAGTLAAAVPSPHNIVADGTNLFWVEGGADGAKWRGDRSAGQRVELASNQSNVRALILDGDYLVWTTDAGAANVDTALRRVRKDGTGQVETLLSNLTNPGSIAANSTAYYVVLGGASSSNILRVMR